MTDSVDAQTRSRVMSKIRGKNTRPEMVVRRLVFSLGFRYRLHRRDLPGTPDLVFAKRRKVIFVHGCYWHRHAGCKFARLPKSHLDFWLPKLQSNVERDARNIIALGQSGWLVLTLWECELSDIGRLRKRICEFLT
ncbi:very short patch repair endonuclease [Paraburkholderia nemoris]|uniref:very short patch repair endonuclease n=1 Tax=Paraburkholderia nemoris TaxID=2793076 RepID=UPI0038BB73BD